MRSRIHSLNIVNVFEQDEGIVLSCGPVLKQLEKDTRGKIIQLNTPIEAPPNLPRLVLDSADFTLQISFERFQLVIKTPTHIVSDSSLVLDFATERTQQILSKIVDIMPGYKWSGVIGDIDYEIQKPGLTEVADIATTMFDRLVNIDRRERDLGSFIIHFGLSENGYFVNYKLSGYEKRSLQVGNTPLKQGANKIHTKDMLLDELGVTVNVDINNRISSESSSTSPIDDSIRLIEKFRNYESTLIRDLNLEGFIDG